MLRSDLEAGVVDNRRSPFSRMTGLPIRRVRVRNGFWGPRIESNRQVSVPKLLSLLDEHGVVDNFRRISAQKQVARQGPLYTDSDLYKWMEGAAFLLDTHPDPELESILDSIVRDVVGAQASDGYLNTFFVEEHAGERYTDFGRNHEFYCAGHLIQAAIAHHRATGKEGFLNCAIRFADHLISVFGTGRRKGFSGHPELEMAMVELYRTTGKGEYLDFARYLLDQIGFSAREAMEGHAVRAGYACCGGADYYAETGDEPTWVALDRLWHDMVSHKVYITGGLGSRHVGEAFGEPYELPNLRAYAETCAAVSNLMWNWRMLCIRGQAKYGDLFETILYNGFLAGVSLSGGEYFYVNPLESSGPRGKERGNVRNEWYTTTCCPTNVVRTIASLPGYLYGMGDPGIWVNLYQTSTVECRVGESEVVLDQETSYPWSGEVEIVLSSVPNEEIALVCRMPGWAPICRVSVNDEPASEARPGSYERIERTWRSGDRIRLSFAMETRLVQAHHRVREDFGCVAICRGPLVYCVESIDNPGFEVQDLMLGPDSSFHFQFSPELLGGVGVLRFNAFVAEHPGTLYEASDSARTDLREVTAVAIPYYSWANRGASSMLVWIPMTSPLNRYGTQT